MPLNCIMIPIVAPQLKENNKINYKDHYLEIQLVCIVP